MNDIPDAIGVIELAGIDPNSTLGAHGFGHRDPTCARTHGSFTRTWYPAGGDGPATLQLSWDPTAPTEVAAAAWGPAATRALAQAGALLGRNDRAEGFNPEHPTVRDLHRRHRGLRIGASGDILGAAVQAALGQRVTTTEALSQWRRVVERYGEPAPGPFPALRCPPSPGRLATAPGHELHRLGIERSRAAVLHAVARHARRIEEAATMTSAEADRRLQAIPGIGPWTSAMVRAHALGDADAVPLGDYGIPGLVGHVLAGEDDADDDRMCELLEPYRPHRWRVIRLLFLSGLSAPRHAPRARIRRVEH